MNSRIYVHHNFRNHAKPRVRVLSSAEEMRELVQAGH